MDTMEQEVMTPIESDVSEAVPIKTQLDSMEKPELIKYMEGLGYNIDRRLSEKTIKENILKIIADRKNNAAMKNKASLDMTVSKDDPMIKVRFFNLESANTDIQFSYAGKRGMYGPKYMRDGKKYGNPNGHRKCPTYHLFPGETVELAYSVYEHLMDLTFVTHKTVFDPVSGMIQGNIPIIKPRFILQPIFSKEDILNINKNR